MRYSKGHKEETRHHIINVASQSFREEGIEKIGIAALMKDAGLTVGGFYGHFQSKEELIEEAVKVGADETSLRIFRDTSKGEKASLELVLQRYLSVEHRDAAGTGCVIAALASELKNRPAQTRTVIAAKAAEFIEGIANCLPSDVASDVRLRCAGAIWAVMVGTLQLSRIIPDQELSTQFLKDGIANATKIAAGIKQPCF